MRNTTPVDALRLMNLMGMDKNNAQHTLAVADALDGVEPGAFIEFCREHKDGIEYQSKTEKLDTLKRRYLRQLPKEILEKAHTFASKVAAKVKACRDSVEFEGCGFEHVFYRDDQENLVRYFTYKELESLAKWPVPVVIELSRRGELEEMIENKYTSGARKLIESKRSNEDRDTAALTKKAIRRIA